MDTQQSFAYALANNSKTLVLLLSLVLPVRLFLCMWV